MHLQLGYVHTYTFLNQHRFQKSPFSPVHTTTQRFRKSPFSKVSTFKPVFESLRFRWKRRLSKTLNKRLRVEEGENEQKSLRFRMKTYTCGRGLNILLPKMQNKSYANSHTTYHE